MKDPDHVEIATAAAVVAMLALVAVLFWSAGRKPPCVEYGPSRLILVPQKIGDVTHMRQHWVRSCVRRADEEQ